MDAALTIEQMGKSARRAARALANAPHEQRIAVLLESARQISEQSALILAANAKDLEQNSELSLALVDRLRLDERRIDAMADAVEKIAHLKDPLGRELTTMQRPNGLSISRVSCPLGVVGLIYEARPNVTADAAALCLKSGNAVILRPGSESFYSSHAIFRCFEEALKFAALDEACVQMVPSRERAFVTELLKANRYIDVIIPRGGRSLTELVLKESLIPTLLHLDGNCHTYIHASAKPSLALDVLYNAKLRRTGICGATESLVIDRAIATTLLPQIVDKLKGCELRGDAAAVAIDSRIKSATEEDFYTEYLSPILSVKVVDGLEEAIDFVNEHSSHHTDAIIAEAKEAAELFLARVDSAIVMHNTSTQFADGGEFGMGAEIGIATGRLHARGPVGAEQLTTYKYLVRGNGQVRP